MSSYINAVRSLSYYRTRLIGLVRDKGVTADSSEKLDQLINKVSNIKTHNDIIHSQWTTTTDVDTFTWSGLNFMPAKIGLASSYVLNKSNLSSTDKIYVGALSIDLNNMTEQSPGIFVYDESGKVNSQDLSSAISVTVSTRNVSGATLYDLSISFSEYNKPSSSASNDAPSSEATGGGTVGGSTFNIPIYFKAAYEYELVITSQEWFIN